MPFVQQALILLGAAVVSVPLFKRLGLGSVVGYLVAGVVIGPWGLGLFTQPETILQVAELGVVLLLFLVGLELEPSRLWELRRQVFGLGGAQVLVTGALLSTIGLLVGLRPDTALIAGAGLALSSTAFAHQLLEEKNEQATAYGLAALGILLFQDLAVIPLLALLALLGVPVGTPSGAVWRGVLEAIGGFAVLVVGSRFVLRPLFRVVATMRSRELFTATALLAAIGTAQLVHLAGLSMALGAFLAGVLLADSEYRHELQADVEPFKGLLLGLFFLGVGMSMNIGLLSKHALLLLVLVLGLMLLKALVLFALGRLSLGSPQAGLNLAAVMLQGGEFAFVLFDVAAGARVMDRELAQLLVVVVSFSMALSPLLFALHARLLRPRLERREPRPFEVVPVEENPVIIAGFGRMGQVVGRILQAKRIGFTAMDIDPEHIEFLKRFGNKVFYGDASRLDLLRAARADKAKVFVLAIDDVDASLRTAELVLRHFPHLTVFARARNRQHAYRLLELGINHVIRETFASSLEMTGKVLEQLGLTHAQSWSTIERFREYDEELLRRTFRRHRDEEALAELMLAARQELESLFEEDEAERAPTHHPERRE
ncbi:MAG: monovalent cation:proton antiporter-2 (CPA2) family protein [Myxococcaceae bacterium]|nr:monovalent cation:proton antiporter-2 (CPA2) family protein [Myxococcaceae bacterium]